MMISAAMSRDPLVVAQRDEVGNGVEPAHENLRGGMRGLGEFLRRGQDWPVEAIIAEFFVTRPLQQQGFRGTWLRWRRCDAARKLRSTPVGRSPRLGYASNSTSNRFKHSGQLSGESQICCSQCL